MDAGNAPDRNEAGGRGRRVVSGSKRGGEPQGHADAEKPAADED
jgi:hypothetical protein